MAERVRAGDLLDDKYLVERIIGEGGAGYVAAARHVLLQRRVALKFLRPELASHPELRARFLREAQAVARLRSDHVARVLDADSLGAGQPYFAMEYLEGQDIAAALRREGPFAAVDAVDCLLQACKAIEEAHGLGIIHRDIKPSNLFLTQTPEGRRFVKVLDFGLSKALDGAGASLTGSHHVVGSPHFMSPEQIRTPCEVDARTDIWSLGATLFTMLAGRVPFDGRSLIEVCGALLCGPPPRIARAGVHPELEAIVLRCLCVEPEGRYPSVSALARELIPFGSQSPEGTMHAVAAAPASPDAAPRVAPRRAARSRWGLLGLAVASAAAMGIAAHTRREPRSEATPVQPRPDDSGATSEPAVGPKDRSTRERAPPEADAPAAAMPDGPRRAAASGPGARDASPSPTGAASIAAAPARSQASAYGAAAFARPPLARADLATTGTPHLAGPPFAAGAAPAPSSSCAQPFYIDARGLKAIRPECM
jgi:serine/threonine-protein kinase